jgi:hypothetical protein
MPLADGSGSPFRKNANAQYVLRTLNAPASASFFAVSSDFWVENALASITPTRWHAEDTIAWLLREAGAVKPISHEVTCAV